MGTAALAVTSLALLLFVTYGAAGFRCACTINCSDDEPGICRTDHQCFTQYIKIQSAKQPVAYGCLPGRTPLLCESWLHRATNPSSNQPTRSVVCCDSDLCNRIKKASRQTEIPILQHSRQSKDQLTPLIQGDGTTSKPSHLMNRFHVLDKHIVLSTLFVGLIALIGVLSFGFYLLYKQSQTVKRLCKNYNPGESEMFLAESSSTASC